MALECLPRSGRYGFNLLEMLVLLSAIAVAFSVASQVAPIRVKHSAVEATKQEMDALRMALLDYYRDNAAFPDGLARLAGNPSPPVATWNGPYIRATSTLDDYAKDGWGNPYQYAYTPGAWGADSVRLYSIGPNRVDETLGANSDDISAQGPNGRIGSAEIRKEIELMVQAELVVIQQAAGQYLMVETAPLSNINQLYNKNYLYDNSYHDDLWGRHYEYESAGSRFYSRGPNEVKGGGDDISPPNGGGPPPPPQPGYYCDIDTGGHCSGWACQTGDDGCVDLGQCPNSGRLIGTGGPFPGTSRVSFFCLTAGTAFQYCGTYLQDYSAQCEWLP